ncbi:MAG: hypothetical protein AAFY44_10040, partial [Pseudomonadota bacterium]
MSGWVKVCGLTTPDAVAAAIEAGVDAVGFVFAESPRAVSVDAAVLLAGLHFVRELGRRVAHYGNNPRMPARE